MGTSLVRKRAKKANPDRPKPISHSVELAESWRRERPDLEHTELLFQIFVMRLGRMMDAAYDRMCQKAYGISGAEMRVLFALRRAGPPYTRRPTDLFKALLVTSGAITKQVDRLQAAGFVERRPDPAFGGGFLVHLTDKGRAAADQMVEALCAQSLISPATAKLGRAELERALRFLERLLQYIEVEGLNSDILAP